MKLTEEIINEKVEQLRKELLDMVEPKFELNRWYKSKTSPKMWFIEKVINNGDQKSFGFNAKGDWMYSDVRQSEIKEFELATPSEVQAALEAEAVKRGFKEGVMFKCLEKGVVRPYRPYYKRIWDKGVEMTFRYYEDGDHLFCFDGLWNEGLEVCSNPSIYRAGKWATIIPQEKTSEEWCEAFNNRPQSTLNKFLKDNNLKITKK